MKVGADGVYKAIVELSRHRGYPPTVREICDHVGINSTSTVHASIQRLVRDGRIVHDPTKPRTIKLVDKAETPVSELREALRLALDRRACCDDEDRCEPCLSAAQLLRKVQ